MKGAKTTDRLKSQSRFHWLSTSGTILAEEAKRRAHGAFPAAASAKEAVDGGAPSQGISNWISSHPKMVRSSGTKVPSVTSAQEVFA